MPRTRQYRMVGDTRQLQCHWCFEFKNFSEYYTRLELLDQCRPYCKECVSKYSKKRNTKEKNRENVLRKHGINQEIYDQLYQNQEGKCKICNKFEELLHIDHCHSTMRVRGLLCNPCNNGLGAFRDDITLLYSAIDYLIGRTI